MTMDARYIAQSDNTAVTTWVNKGSSSYDMTQATTAAKPTFRDGTNGLNGLPTLNFDGGDLLEGINTSLSTYSIVSVASRAASGANPETIFSRGTTNSASYTRDVILYYSPTSSSVSLQRSSATQFPTATVTSVGSGAHVVHARYDGTDLGLRVDEGTEVTIGGTTPASPNAPWAIGATRENNTINYYFRSKISLVAVWNGSVLSAPLRKRASHAAGYSFKVACS
jgi:hypothetical protein